MESRGPLATWHRLSLLLLLLPPARTHQDQAMGYDLPSQQAQDPPARHLSNGLGQEPVAVMKINLTKIIKPSSSFEFRTWDPEGVIFYGDTNAEDDWFVLALRDGRPEIQLHNLWAQLTVGTGPQLDDGRWHQVEIKIDGDSLLLWVDGEEMLRLRQVSGPLANKSQPIMRIALGGLLFPVSSLRLPLLPALDGCMRKDTWLGHQAQPSAVFASLRDCSVNLQPGMFFPPGAHAEFRLQDIPQPHAEPWVFSLDLTFKLAAGSGHLLALGTEANSSCLSLHLQDQEAVLSSGAGLQLALPLALGLPLQLKLGMFRVALSQGPNTEVLVLPPLGFDPLFNLWSQPQGRLFLGALPGEDSSASFCLDGLWAQGQRLDIDQALSRSRDIWTHSCPQSPGNGSDTSY
uniref:sex hormone-binding globulin isoform X1 n=1 Tax=Jaculus jaculus TaxID=51337 RepID=UPI001E1AFF41|nr:sex hormone-binding globulin isoform X1 [Jaculus jaculus]